MITNTWDDFTPVDESSVDDAEQVEEVASYSVTCVGELTVWSKKASLANDKSCEHCELFVAWDARHSFSQSKSARLKSLSSQRCAPLRILERQDLSWVRYS